MKTFETLGDGPDNDWFTDEQRAAGVEKLREDFARELERAMGGERREFAYITQLIVNDAGVARAVARLYWGRIWRPSTKTIDALLKSVQGGRFRLNKRFVHARGKMLWGFDQK